MGNGNPSKQTYKDSSENQTEKLLQALTNRTPNFGGIWLLAHVPYTINVYNTELRNMIQDAVKEFNAKTYLHWSLITKDLNPPYDNFFKIPHQNV